MPTVPLKVYGDPFVFKMRSESRESEEYRPAMYLHMDSGFVDSATSRRPVGAWAFCLLRRLYYVPTEEYGRARKPVWPRHTTSGYQPRRKSR